MNKDPAESRGLVQKLLSHIGEVKHRTVIVIPPFTSLPYVNEILHNSSLKVGAQNMHWERSGAFTGEISGLFLTSIGVEYVLIGHSERRHIMGESDDMINRKLKTALDIGLISIFCVGETEQEREQSPDGSFFIYDGFHRSLVLAKYLVEEEIDYQQVEGILVIPRPL